MVLRFLTLLLAIVMMTSAVAQASSVAAPGAALVIEAPDAPDLDPLVLPESSPPAPIAVTAEVVTPTTMIPDEVGRRHTVLVFRPPRLSASR